VPRPIRAIRVTRRPVLASSVSASIGSPASTGYTDVMATVATPGPDGPLGYQQITDMAAATALTIPAPGTPLIGGADSPSQANAALIQCETADVRWRDDGTNPTTAIGMILAAGETMLYTGNLNRIRFIESGATAVLNVSYYAIYPLS
jgi:hypothetical protein